MPYGTVNADLMTTSDGVSSSGLYGFKNRIINGAMVIDQRNAGASVTQTSSYPYTLDRWQCGGSVSSKFTVQQSSTAPTGFVNSSVITSFSTLRDSILISIEALCPERIISSSHTPSSSS